MKNSMLPLPAALCTAVLPRWDRVLPGTSDTTASGMGTSTLNLVLIVAFAVGITFLARYLAQRGGRHK